LDKLEPLVASYRPKLAEVEAANQARTPAFTAATRSLKCGESPVRLRVLSMSGSQPLDTGTATGRLMLAVIGAVGQAEREAMLERQREGIAKAKALGRYKGRVPTVRKQAAIRFKAAGVRSSEIASRLGIGRASVYRVLGESVDREAA
jgi:DNA invertase Pin-like site-specific DNA recombinase